MDAFDMAAVLRLQSKIGLKFNKVRLGSHCIESNVPVSQQT
jgi:hypothetical protein